MSGLIEWESVCLVCLQKGENRYIFGEDNDSIVIADKIMKYSDILIKRDTNQPKSICLQCLDDLNVAHKFGLNYEQSESIIKGVLNTNHQEFQIKDLWKTSPTTGNPILEICIKDEVVDNTAVGDGCENKPCPDLKDDPDTKAKFGVEDRADSFVHSDTTELNNMKTGQNNESNQKMNSKIPKESRGQPGKLSDESTFSSAYNRPLKRPGVGASRSTGVSSKICEICNHDFRSQIRLDEHMRRHNNERPFSCVQCGKAFVSGAELRSHMKVHTGEKPYKCQYCDLRFSEMSVKQNHESKHTGEKPFKCPTCDKSFGYSKGLREHLQTHNKFTCKECGKKFMGKKPFQNHVNTHLTRDELNTSSEHTQKKSLEKEIFQIQGNTNSSEINIKHGTGEDVLINDNCGIESTPCIDLDNGPVSKPTNGEIPKQPKGVSLKICEICNHGFKYQSTLNSHMKRHNNERPFNCEDCGNIFLTLTALRSHMRVHPAEKPYKCQYCDLRFANTNDRLSHESEHLGEKPFKCPACDNSFEYSKDLKIHLRIHNKFTCKECDIEFIREPAFQKHVNSHLIQNELKRSSEHKRKKLIEKEIFQIQENTNSNEINIKHEIVEDLIGDNCDMESTPCIDVDNGPVSEAVNGEIVQQLNGKIAKYPRVRPKQSTGVSLRFCEICNHGFKHQSVLNIHMRRHKNERPFNCDHCDKAFLTLTALRSHMRHTGEKRYKCQYCNLRFANTSDRLSHESEHMGEKPFKCLACDNSFEYSKDLKIHLRIHNKFTCKECGKEFIRMKNFQNHVNRHPTRGELHKSSEHRQKKLLEKEIFQIQETTNSNEIDIRDEIVEDDLIGDNCDMESTSCIDVDNDPVSENTNGEIVQQSKGEIPKHPTVRPKQSTGVSLTICEICNHDFKKESILDMHMRRHNNERHFSCVQCGKAFVSHAELRRHMRVHTGEKPYKCQYCDLRFCDSYIRQNHESNHTGVKPYKCLICDKSFGYSKGLITHLRIHNKFTCKECGKRFTTKKLFQNHVDSHLTRDERNKSSEKKSLEKEIFQVQENTNSNEIIIKHEIVEDGNNCDMESTPCVGVDNGSVSEGMKREIVQQSTGEISKQPRVRPKQSTGISLIICEICNHGFRYQNELDNHMRRHNIERPFSCDHCGKAFVTRTVLRTHMRVHTGEKPYKCQYCDRRFTYADARQNHESKHTGERPFKCPICEKSYGYSKGLITHLRMHNKFTCKECGKEFTGKEPFERHIAHHLTGSE